MSEVQGTTSGVMKPGPDSLALVGAQNSPPPQQVSQGSSAYNAGGAAFFRMVSGGAASFFSGEDGSSGSGGQQKRKGRPRRYGPDGAIVLPRGGATVTPPEALLQLTAPPPQVQVPPPSQVAPPPTTTIGADLASPTPAAKKTRGRPPGSSNKKPKQIIDAMGFRDLFNPHVLYIHPGEDVSSKIMAVTHHGQRDICVMSANGHISNVMIRQPAIYGGTVSYEGRFEILSLSGSFLLAEVGGQQTRTGGLNVSLAGPDGRIFGGAVAGLLIAASPVQLVVGSFRAHGRKEMKPAKSVDISSAPPRVHPGAAPGASSPPSRGTVSESSGGSGSPLDPPTGFGPTSSGQGMPSMSRQ